MSGFWRGRRVLVTGHTGFKGGWLSLWLSVLGAEVTGYALHPAPGPSFFEATRLAGDIDSRIADVRDQAALRETLQSRRPQVIFHLAARSLVRESYEDPLETFSTNVLGTASVLEAVRSCASAAAVVVVTSDKCYENREWIWPYRESDPVGGYDPYSSSKACAELVTSAFRNSFFNADRYVDHGVGLASARSGNVIGGGDWARDRLVPDLVRGAREGRVTRIRNPGAVRPWQHVLEPLAGYLELARRLTTQAAQCAGPWNFGPDAADSRRVEQVADAFCRALGRGARWTQDEGSHPHEAQQLRLDWSKARAGLDWQPRLGLDEGLRWTAEWYGAWLSGDDVRALSLRQIALYERLA